MKRLLVGLLLLVATLAGAQTANTMKDDLGREVAQVGAGKRLVSLSPFITEAIFTVNAWPELVGVSEFSDFPAYARSLPKVAGSTGVAWERLAAVRPDLVFAWKDTLKDGDLERFKQLNIPVFVLSGRRLDDVPRTLRAIAFMVGRNAPEALGLFEQRIARLREAHAGKPRVPVLVEVQHRPLITIAGEHFVNDALAVCGAENAFALLPGVAPEVSWEALMARDPAAIVGAGAAANEPAFRERWAVHKTLRAVKSNALVYVDGDSFYRPTVRLADAIDSLCRQLDKVR